MLDRVANISMYIVKETSRLMKSFADKSTLPDNIEFWTLKSHCTPYHEIL